MKRWDVNEADAHRGTFGVYWERLNRCDRFPRPLAVYHAAACSEHRHVEQKLNKKAAYVRAHHSRQAVSHFSCWPFRWLAG
jgi:hypothetical protein